MIGVVMVEYALRPIWLYHSTTFNFVNDRLYQQQLSFFFLYLWIAAQLIQPESTLAARTRMNAPESVNLLSPHCRQQLQSKNPTSSINACIFTWVTFVPNFIPVRFETTKPLAFMKRSPSTRRTLHHHHHHHHHHHTSRGILRSRRSVLKQRETVRLIRYKMSSGKRSVPDLKILCCYNV